MTIDSGLGAAAARPTFEAGFFSRTKRDDATRAEPSALPLGRSEEEDAAPPIRPLDGLARAPEEAGRRPADRHSGALLSVDTVTRLQGDESDGDEAAAVGEEAPSRPGALSPEEEAHVRELKETDREVRAHERAHAAAGGVHAGQPTYTFENGPDGGRYAVAGQVSIDTSPVSGDPQATIDKAEQIKRAASAPAEPSSQDRQVAAAAEALRREAQDELNSQRTQEASGGEGEPAAPAAATPAGTGEGGQADSDDSALAARDGSTGDGEQPEGREAAGGILERILGPRGGEGEVGGIAELSNRLRDVLGAEPPGRGPAGRDDDEPGGIPDGTLIDRATGGRPGATIDVRI